MQDAFLAYLYLDFDKNIGQGMTRIRHVITDRVRFEAIKQFIQERIRNEGPKSGHFPNQSPLPEKVEKEEIEYEYEYVFEEEEEEEKDDFEKDPGWKP